MVVLLMVIYFCLTVQVGYLLRDMELCVEFDVSISGWQALTRMVSELPVSSMYI